MEQEIRVVDHYTVVLKFNTTIKFLSSKTIEILVNAFVSSKLDYCNSLLYNVPKYVLKKIQ